MISPNVCVKLLSMNKLNAAAAAMGRKGGKATGARKTRSRAHYQRMAQLSAAVRRAKG